MASLRKSVEGDSASTDDPWYWSVDQVVTALCDRNGPFLRSIDPISIPDPACLEKALRENVISGPTLLTGLTYATLREELGIKPLGHRTTILHLIRDWQRQSARYIQHIQLDSPHSYFSGYQGVSSVGHPNFVTPNYGSPLQHLPRAISIASGITQSPRAPSGYTPQLPHTPLSTIENWSFCQQQTPVAAQNRPLQGLGLPPSEKESFESAQPTEYSSAITEVGNNHNSVGSKRQNIQIGVVPPADPLNNAVNQSAPPSSSASTTTRPGESYFVDESGKKRPRLDLTAVALNQGLGIIKETSLTVEEPLVPLAPLDIFEGTPVGQFEDREDTTVGPQDSHATGGISLSQSPEDHAAGELVIDNRGRKRMKPILVTSRNYERHNIASKEGFETKTRLDDQLSTTSPDSFKFSFVSHENQKSNLRNPEDMYLGVESLPVDTIFYGNTVIGQEINNDVTYGDFWQLGEAKKSEFFIFHTSPFGSGQRRYVGGRMKHYFSSSNSRAFSHKGQGTILPYENSLARKHHPVSATVFRKSLAKIIATRMDRSKWLDDDLHFFRGQEASVNVFGRPNEAKPTENWDYLEKWNYKEERDDVLPVYGDSGSEGQYDIDTWREMEGEQGKITRIERSSSKHRGNRLNNQQVDEAIELAMRQNIEHWRSTNEPKLRLKAWRLWMMSRKKGDKHPRMAALSKAIKYLKTRLLRIVKEIQERDWSTVEQIQKQCKSLQPSQYDLEDCKWKLSVIQSKAMPEKPSPRLSKAVKVRQPSNNPEEDVESGRTESESSDGDLDGFIVDDEDSEAVFFTAPNENGLSDFQVDGKEISRSTTPDVDTPSCMEIDAVDSTNNNIKVEGMEAEAVSHKARNAAGANLPLQRHSAKLIARPLDIIDLTTLSEASDQESQPKVSKSLSAIRTPPLFPVDEEDPFRRDPDWLTAFKAPPVVSDTPPVVDLDSDSLTGTKATDDDLHEVLPDFNEVDKINLMSVDLLVERKDRKRLLIWTIGHTPALQRQEVVEYVDQTPFQDIQSLVWSGLMAFLSDNLRIDTLDKADSDTLMRMAAWYVCWTIPVKVSAKPPGVKAKHITTALADQKGFQVFYAFLGECLNCYGIDPDSSMTSKPRKRALLEDSDSSMKSTPHRKHRKYAVPESQETKDLRSDAQKRVHDRDKRQEDLKKRLQQMGVNEEDPEQVIINTGKHDDQEFIYLNPTIGDKIQRHQQKGVQFMWREVIDDHQGCLLAQTMGLGKTMQVITLLVTIAEAARSSNDNIRNQVPENLRESRTLVLCPPALVENWWEEFLMWTPLSSTTNIGEPRKVTAAIDLKERLYEIEAWQREGGILIMGYNTFRDLIQNNPRSNGMKRLDDEQHKIVKSTLLDFPNIIVADEAHAAKKTSSGINQTMQQLKSMSRIALTGSPLANNLEEYHSLIDWIAPNYLGTSVEFKANYAERIQEGLWQDSSPAKYRDSLKWLEVLKKELEPKVYRADISALAGRLKEKQEFVIRVPLTPLQEEIYRISVNTMGSVANEVDQKTPAVWALLSVLRLVCNHPKCFKDKLLARPVPKTKAKVNKQLSQKKALLDGLAVLDEDNALLDASVSEIGISQPMIDRQLAPFSAVTEPIESTSHSNKMLILEAIVQFSREAGDKILIFSHTLDTLNYIEVLLKNIHARYFRIDGKVKPTARQQITKDFNNKNKNIEVCIISTRSGGQGLNLYGANRVIIMDDHYNPMYEEQAVGRAYRIGQTKAVFVYYLMAGGTFEEVLHNQSVFKQQLAKRVVDKKNPARRALRGIGEYLLPPKPLEQHDLKQFFGNDPLVLDQILALQDKNPIIRSMDYTETFHEEDTITLTVEEKREADQLQKDEKLRRADPAAFEAQMRKRKIDQQRAIDAQISSIRAQGTPSSLAPAQDPHEAFLNFQNTNTLIPADTDRANVLQPGTGDPMTGIQQTSLVPTHEPVPKSPLSAHLDKAGLPPVQASNTRMQSRATESPERQEDAPKQSENAIALASTSPGLSAESLKAYAPYPQLKNLLDREAIRMRRKKST